MARAVPELSGTFCRCPSNHLCLISILGLALLCRSCSHWSSSRSLQWRSISYNNSICVSASSAIWLWLVIASYGHVQRIGLVQNHRPQCSVLRTMCWYKHAHGLDGFSYWLISTWRPVFHRHAGWFVDEEIFWVHQPVVPSIARWNRYESWLESLEPCNGLIDVTDRIGRCVVNSPMTKVTQWSTSENEPGKGTGIKSVDSTGWSQSW